MGNSSAETDFRFRETVRTTVSARERQELKMLFGFIPGAPGWIEIAIFGAIILLVFGNRLPGAMRSLGRSVVEFKKGANDADSEIADDGDGSKDS